MTIAIDHNPGCGTSHRPETLGCAKLLRTRE
jgi:hypothetical protein